MQGIKLFYTVVVFFTLVAALVACDAVGNSAGKVFESAGGVIKQGGDRAFIEPEATPIKGDRY